MQAMTSSLAKAGIRMDENSLDSDAVIVWSVLWAGRMAKNQAVYEHYRNQNRPIIVIDAGALCRNRTWRIAIGHVNALGYFGNTCNLDADRPKQLGIELGLRQYTTPDILIAAQHRASLQLQGLDQENWICQQVQQLQAHTDRHIRIRSHPRSPLNTARLPSGCSVDTPRRVPNTYDDFDFYTGYHAVVNYSSTPGIQSAINGTPVVVTPASLAHPVSVQYKDIENPPDVDREQWLIELAHTEYLTEEIEQGLWLTRLSAKL